MEKSKYIYMLAVCTGAPRATREEPTEKATKANIYMVGGKVISSFGIEGLGFRGHSSEFRMLVWSLGFSI